MKRVLMALAIVAVSVSGAMALSLTLSPQPDYFDGTFTSSAGSLYVNDDVTGDFPVVLGTVQCTYGYDDKVSAKIELEDDVTQVGMISRARVPGETTASFYTAIMDPANDYFTITKIRSSGAQKANLASYHTTDDSINLQTGGIYGVTLWTQQAPGGSTHVNLFADLYNSSGVLLKHLQAHDDGTLVGAPLAPDALVGTVAYRGATPIVGTWTEITETVPEPGTVAMLIAGALALLGWAGLRRR